jgi:SAM-dependent methyltransferase
MDATVDDSLLVLGRQPELGLAELESLYGAGGLRLVGAGAALVQVMPCSVDFARLGASVKLCKILATLETTSWASIVNFLASAAPAQASKMPKGKMHLGISELGFGLAPAKISASGLTIKKAIAKSGRSVRLVPNNASELSSAQVIHHKLLNENGWELVIVKDGAKTIIAQSLEVQDIASYTRRDRGRPGRDTRVGMLPPKLAQLIINLATGADELNAISDDQAPKICRTNAENAALREKRAERTLLDPFCGTGVILQEALLMGYHASGTDAETRMTEYSQANLEWLATSYLLTANGYRLSPGDATSYQWDASETYAVASETYLGRPFTSVPSAEILDKTASEVNVILKKFLSNIHKQLPSGARLCLAVPAWQTSPGRFRHLALVDQLGDLGYNQVRFEHARREDLLYYRENQIVARELLVITRK